MKNTLKILCAYLIISFLIISINNKNVLCQPEQHPYAYKNEEIILETKKSIENLIPTGDIDIDFLSQIIIINQGAINIAKNNMKNGDNTNVKNLSKAIIKKQTKDMEYIKNIMEKLKKSPIINKDKEIQYLTSYKDIINKFFSQLEDIKTTVNIDADYLYGVLVFKETLVDMAENIMKYTDNDDIKKLANNIIENKTQDVERVKELLIEVNS